MALFGYRVGSFGTVVGAAGTRTLQRGGALHRRRRELESRRLLERLQSAAQERGERLGKTLQELAWGDAWGSPDQVKLSVSYVRRGAQPGAPASTSIETVRLRPPLPAGCVTGGDVLHAHPLPLHKNEVYGSEK